MTYSAHDMAQVQAEKFREGVASVTVAAADLVVLLASDPVTMFAMAEAFRKAHDEHAGLKVAKIYAAGQRAEANVIAGLRAALEVLSTRAAAQPQGVWRPIESAPRDGTEVLLWNGVETVIGEWLKCASPYWLTGFAGDTESTYTHWAPLPTPPPAELGDDDGR